MQHHPPGEAVGGELGAVFVVEVEGVESLADGAAIPHASLCFAKYECL